MLTSEQTTIVTTEDRIVSIIAGPGTGKTRTLTNRIAYLIQNQHINPAAILALTFTKKAAAEMHERLAVMHKGQLPTITTFHGFCLEQLSNVGKVPILITEAERHDIINSIKKSRKDTRSVRDLSLLITQAKSSPIVFNDPVLSQYNDALASQNIWDFDDILLNFYHKINNTPEVLEQIHCNIRYIFVDEFQDTNAVQYQIIKLLMSGRTSLFVIGDPLQSIYAFRGANSEIFQQLKADYPESHTYTLSTNFRSDQNLVTISNRLFKDIVDLTSASQEKGKACLVTTYDSFSEADWIVETIGKHIGGSDLLKADHTQQPARFSDFAIIYRNHRQSGPLEKRLNVAGFPYQSIGGQSLYEKPDIAFAITALRYLSQSSEETKIELLRTPLLRRNPNLLAILPTLQSTLTETIQAIAQAFALDDTAIDFQQFLGMLVRFDSSQTGVTDFLSYYDYLKSHEFYDVTADKITLLTMHAAKGLEFPIVFIPGFDQTDDQASKSSNDDEQRLLYVALTRAEHELYLISAQFRNKQKTKLSKFQTFIEGPTLELLTDEAIAKIAKRQELWKKKNAQINLFEA